MNHQASWHAFACFNVLTISFIIFEISHHLSLRPICNLHVARGLYQQLPLLPKTETNHPPSNLADVNGIFKWTIAGIQFLNFSIRHYYLARAVLVLTLPIQAVPNSAFCQLLWHFFDTRKSIEHGLRFWEDFIYLPIKRNGLALFILKN
jgi:hypothetical protein